ncbi:MAG: hypothetical protein IJ292_01840 [Clostridia bacterium]|nr:hypothetical protein [Clostridia bacterium]
MKKITKEMCTVFIKDYNNSKPIFIIFVSLFALVALWFFTQNIVIVSILAAVALAAILFMIYKTNKKNNNVNLEDFYLVEDVIVDCKKRISTKASGGSGHNYIYTFRDSGEYTIHKSAHPTVEIPLHKEKNIDHLSVENLCIQSCEKGDIFYLLILKEKDRTKIIKCFPKFHFDIAQEGFDCIDGKYYCRK